MYVARERQVSGPRVAAQAPARWDLFGPVSVGEEDSVLVKNTRTLNCVYKYTTPFTHTRKHTPPEETQHADCAVPCAKHPILASTLSIAADCRFSMRTYCAS